MEKGGKNYSVLIVSTAENINSAICSMLPGTGCAPARIVTGIGAARRAAAEKAYDIVIINSPLPDDPGIDLACELCAGSSRAVLIIVRDVLYDETMDAVSGAGVFVLARPLSRQTVQMALGWLISARERLRSSEKVQVTFRARMEEMKTIDRAKWLLISELKMDEPEAHRYIEKQAMDRCTSRLEIAEEIVRTYG